MKTRLIASLLLCCMIVSLLPTSFFVFAEETNATITFDTQGGSTVNAQIIAIGSCATEPEDPLKEGFLFGGWTLNGSPYDFSTSVTKSITLKATWQEDTIPDATVEAKVLSFDPAYLQMWLGMTLQMNLITTGNVTRSDGYKFDRCFDWELSVSYYALDSTIASIDEEGNVTAHALGHTYIWAVVEEDATGTFEFGSVSVKKGDVVDCVEVVVEAIPEYYQAYLDDKENQQITLETNSQQDAKVFTAYPNDAFGSANIALFYNNAVVAVSMTCDDNTMSDFAQWNAWYDTYGIPVTFMAPTSTYYECGDKWLDQIVEGSTVQPHGHYHLSTAEYADTRTSAQGWAEMYYGYVDLLKVGIDPVVIGYPCGYNYAEYSKMLYTSGRGTQGALNGMNVKYNNINSFSGFPTYKPEIVKNLSDTPGTWMSVHYHGIGSAKSTTETYYGYIKDQIDAGTLWASTYASVSLYSQERDTATLTILSADQDNGLITFDLHDRMNDYIYDQALTIKITVDDTWQNARATQNGVERSVRIVQDGGKTYAFVDAIPDQGTVTLIKTTVITLEDDNQIIAQITDDGSHNDALMTLSFVVNAEEWTSAYATQNGTVLSSSFSTKACVTTLSVTATPNAGQIVISKNPSSSSGTISMTDLYFERYALDSTSKITISSAEELYYLSEYTRYGRTTKDVTFVLTQDIDLSAYTSFYPIGWYMLYEKSSGDQYERPFEGTFDGQGYTITNFSQNRDVCDAGLFGYTKNATICNLNVEGCVKGIKRVGGVIGYMNGGTLRNVTFKGSVEAVAHDADKNGGSYIGGLVGMMESAQISDCIVKDTTVTTYAGTTLSKQKYPYEEYNSANEFNNGTNIGGFIGGTNYKWNVTTTSYVSNCICEATVTAYAKETQSGLVGASKVGGFIGAGTAVTISSVYVDANVTGNTYVGGIMGYEVAVQDVSIRNSVVYGTVQGNSDVGGLVGYLGGSARSSLVNCYSGVTSVEGTSNKGVIAGTLTGSPKTESLYYLDAGTVGLGTGSIQATKATEQVALTSLNSWATTNKQNSFMISSERLSSTHLPIYTLIFKALNGEIVDTQYVGKGLSGTFPQAPSYLGYVFESWDGSVDNVEEDRVIVAKYTQVSTYKVTFKGKNGEILKEQTVNAGDSATAPEAPDLDGYCFSSWQGSYQNVQKDVIIQATYIPGYTVRFYGMNHALISQIKVAENALPTIPNAPSIETYHFVKWDKDTTTPITQNTDFQAIYEKNDDKDLSIKVVQWHVNGSLLTLTGTRASEFLASLNGEDICLISSVQDIQLPSTEETYKSYAYKTTRGSAAGLGYGVVWNSETYTQDPSAEIFTYTTLIGTDTCVLALPLLEKATGKQVVAVVYYMGANSQTSEAQIKKQLDALFAKLIPLYPNAECFLIGTHMTSLEKYGGALNKTSLFNNYTEPDGYSLNVLYEEDVSTDVADYLMIFTKTQFEASCTTPQTIPATTQIYHVGHTAEVTVSNPSMKGKTYHVVSVLGEDDSLLQNLLVEDGDDVTITVTPEEKPGYEFDSWVGSTTAIHENGAIKASYKKKTFTITFKTSLGEIIETKEVEYGDSISLPQAPAVTGYTFSQWEQVNLDQIEADLEVQALYTINTYSVTFQDEDNSILSTEQIQYNGTGLFPTAPSKANKVFAGWTDEEGTLCTGTSYKVLQAKTFKATYKDIYTITFVNELGETLKTKKVIDGACVSNYDAPLKDGYLFDAWQKDNLNYVFETPVKESFTLKVHYVPNIELFTSSLKDPKTGSLTDARAALIALENLLSTWTSEEQSQIPQNAKDLYATYKASYEELLTGILADLSSIDSIYE